MRPAYRRRFAILGLASLSLAAGAVAPPRVARAASVASTPPMGWNSYDAYGTTITEAQFRAVWLSKPDTGGGWYLAAFNTQSRARTLTATWQALGLSPARYEVRDLWRQRTIGNAGTLAVHLDAHGAALYRLLSH